MSVHSMLNEAKANKRDEFYTRYNDIENELSRYGGQFRAKTVLCNCDEWSHSAFFRYFVKNFNRLGLRRLVCTGFSRGSLHPYAVYVDRVREDGVPVPADGVSESVMWKLLSGDLTHVAGDFRSGECVRLLDMADMVVTNPPFSLFREFVSLLMAHGKRFLVIGHQNSMTHKDIFPFIMENRLWFGYGFKGLAGYFGSVYDDRAASSVHKEGMIRVSGVTWYTNLDVCRRHEFLPLVKTYDPELYPKYDGTDIINVGRTADIPKDYDGIMGVPITFLYKYCPEQFEIVGKIDSGPVAGYNVANPVVDGRMLYKRLAIRKKKDI